MSGAFHDCQCQPCRGNDNACRWERASYIAAVVFAELAAITDEVGGDGNYLREYALMARHGVVPGDPGWDALLADARKAWPA